MLLVVLI